MHAPLLTRLVARFCLCLLLGLAALTPPAAAQTTTTPAATANGQALDYAAWNRLADQAQNILDSGSANEARLNAIRGQIVTWRERFQTAQNPNTARIAVLRGQLDALGPAPAEGQSESDEVAARRKELNDAIAAEQAPALRAAEAFGRADGIIQQIDRQLRERQASALLHLSPSPLLPSSWHAAATEAGQIVTAAGSETRQRRDSLPSNYLRDRLPTVLIILTLALLLLTIGRRWVDSLPAMLSSRASATARDAVAFLVSLLQIMLPFFGVVLAAVAALESGLFGSYGRPLLEALPGAGLSYFLGRWIVVSFFSLTPGAEQPLQMPERAIRVARRNGTALALIIATFQLFSPAVLPLAGLQHMTRDIETIPTPMSEAAAGVWHLPFLILAGVALFRLGHVLRRAIRHAPTDPVPFRYRAAAMIGTVSRIIAVAAPVAALIGYVSAANSVIWSWITTLGLMGLLMLLQNFIGDLWQIVKRGEEGARDALAPVLIGFALALAALPLLALIWGARPSDLSEVWTQIRHGISFGGITISPMAMLMFLLVFAVGYMITRGIQGAFRSSILPKTRMDAGAQNAIVSGLGYLGIVLAAILAVTSAGIDLSSLAIVAGALSLGIGFGMQNIVSNFVSGIILLIERPVTVGDWIQVGSAQGYVKRISVRSTMIQTFDRSDVILPNSDLITGTVTNWTRGNLQGRVIVPISVGYDSDTRAVSRILLELAEDQPLVLVNPPPVVHFMRFGADGLDFELRAILSDVNQGMSVGTELRHQIIERFRKEGIEIPYAQRDIHLRNIEELGRVLRPGAPVPPEPAAEDSEAPIRVEPVPATPKARDEAPGADGDSGGPGDAAR